VIEASAAMLVVWMTLREECVDYGWKEDEDKSGMVVVPG
jgi:hypothetical protein